MIDKLGSTALFLNGQAVTFLAQGKYTEAEAALAEAIEKDPNNPETLVNMIVLGQHQGKQPEVFLSGGNVKKNNPTFRCPAKDMDPLWLSWARRRLTLTGIVKQYAI